MHFDRISRRAVFAALVAAGLAMPALAASSHLHLKGTEWGFTGETGDAARFVQFTSDGRVQGFGGCNRFSGSYTAAGMNLTIGPVVATRRACPPEVMKLENELFQMLEAVRSAETTHLQLSLKSADGGVLATLVRRDFD